MLPRKLKQPPGDDAPAEVGDGSAHPWDWFNDFLEWRQGRIANESNPVDRESVRELTRSTVEAKLGLKNLALATISKIAGQDSSLLIEDPIIHTLMMAAAAFQEFETGKAWLLTPSPSLGNVPPLSLIATEAGRELVANELGLIEHGMF